ncbi:N-acetylmuramoyl-L-alanine amidase [Primorskyibacter flagellatus]|uniref:N-acetylmuramoyl-L-alanine amidase n=2 Tax=Primorskyibacter flagellatus TaxID=1387277 RepID=A0A1W2D6X9_9RHOB|nr:N-acetylmuramoyl-L-alanine amidase [Primorskyibacter flagellatus]
MVVIHYTAMTSAQEARDWLCNPQAEVSAHYVISRCGTVWQLVDEEMRAWHAGAGAWGGVSDVNSRSVGIELANTGAEPFPEPQMAALEDLLRGITARWQVPPERVIGHSDLAPGRKIDPGPRFDWRRLALRGFAVWSDSDLDAEGDDTPAELDDLGKTLEAIGYTSDADMTTKLAAFRLRYRPAATGPASRADSALALKLARDYPVDPVPRNA